MTLQDAKENLQTLLIAWKKGELENPWHVQDDAEKIEDQLINAGLLAPQSETIGLAAQIDAVLNQLTNAQQQRVLPQDIGAMQELLSATDSNITQALNEHTEYWQNINFNSRETAANDYWLIT